MNRERFERELTGNILPFWMCRALDPEGGFHGLIDTAGRVHRDAPRASVINSRVLWSFSAAARVLGTAYLDAARHAYRYLAAKFWDEEHGGVYWSVNPVSDRKQIYAQAFAIYGLAEFYRATAEPGALRLAMRLFDLIEQHSRDRVNLGYLEACSRDWGALADMRLSEKDLNSPKSMNTHLHVMEAYTNLLRVWPDARLRAAQRELLEVTLDRIVDGGHFRLFFDERWNSLSDHVSFGHDIEGSWLLVEAAEALGDEPLLERTRAAAVRMADAVWREGLDSDGSLFYESNGHGAMADPNKHWWAHAEAVVGFYNAWQLSGEERFRAQAGRIWQYIEDKFVDRVHGEWHAKLRPDGTPFREPEDGDACLAGFWKCPYHNSRVCFEMMERLG
jgi:mannobiose 2-epimerase